MIDLMPGDVIAVRSPGFWSAMIRLGAALRDQPNLDNHIAVVHHTRGTTLWVIEGRPGGVGWRDANDYLKSKYTVTNVKQPKSQVQRQTVCDAVEAAIGTPYDWVGIAKDAADALDLPSLWSSTTWGLAVPGHVVCSSLADWAYMKAGLFRPTKHAMAETTPADWTEFDFMEPWKK